MVDLRVLQEPLRPSESTATSTQTRILNTQTLNEKSLGKTRHLSDPSSIKPEIILTEDDCINKLGTSFTAAKKWWIITVIFLVQVSMNFNASVYGSAIEPLVEKFGVSAQLARVGQLAFLIAYAFGCELWAPWSEECGRKRILQLSLAFVNLWQIPNALLTIFGSGKSAFRGIIVFRTLGGLSSAGGSVTLGMVADMWGPSEQQYAVAYVVFSSVAGSVVGPVIGGFLQQYLDVQWNFWFQLMIGAVVQAIHFFTVPETRASCIVTKEAKRLRKEERQEVYSDEEVKQSPTFSRAGMKHVSSIWFRPFIMFVKEPIVLFLSLISGFSDALIFTFLDSLGLVYKQWGWNAWQTGLSFIPIGVGYVIAYLIWLIVIRRQNKIRKSNPDALSPESRLTWLLWTAPFLVLGIFGFAWTSTGPPLPWIASILFLSLIGIANYAIYGATIDYMVASYGPYSASATGGNGFARDFLAGVAAIYARPLYSNLGSRNRHLPYASTLLGCLAFVLIIPIYVFWYFGPKIRARSKFAEEIATERKAKEVGLPIMASATAVLET